MMNWVLSFIKKHPLLFLTILYFLLSALLLWKFGVRYVSDSQRFIDQATHLSNGFYPDRYNIWYVSYSVFILIVSLLSDQITFLVLVQYILGWIAVISIYKATLLLYNNPLAALIASLGMILFIEIPSWNSYVLAESFYISCICFCLWLMARTLQHFSPANMGVAFVLIAFTSMIKPTGIALAAATLFVAGYIVMTESKPGFLKWFIPVIALSVVLLLANQMLKTYLVIENYALGEVIYSIQHLTDKTDYLMVTPPPHLYIPPESNPPLIRMFDFFLHHPIYWSKLFLTKLFFLLFHVRPYWSWSHNLFSVTFLLPAYALFITSIRKEKDKKIQVFVISYVLIHILSVCCTSEDWDGRFLMPMLPAIFIIASRQMCRVLPKVDQTNG